MSRNCQSIPLAEHIQQNLKLPPNQFQRFLQTIHDAQPIKTCSIITQLQFQSKSKQQRQKLATSFNYLIWRCFKRNHKNPQHWHLFVQNIAVKKQKSRKQQIPAWKIHKITQKSLHKFVQSFQQQFTPIFQSLYYKLNTSTKILLQSIVIHGDVDDQPRVMFLKQTFQQYIRMGMDLIMGLCELTQQQILEEMDNRLGQYLTNLKDTLLYLHVQSTDRNQEEYIVNKVCRSDQLFNLVYQCVFLNFLTDYEKVYPKQTQQGPAKYPLLFSQKGSYHLQQCHNNLKSIGLQIFCAVLNRYSHKSTMSQFDQSKFLNLMENLTPCLINQLINTNTNKLTLTQNEKLTIAMLCTIRKSSQYLFMNNFMWGNYKRIFWKIIYPLLTVSDQQKRQYQDDPEAFIAQAETLVQKQFQESDKVESCKTYAGFLLENLVDNVDGAVTMVVNEVIAILDCSVNGVENQISKQVKEQFKVKQSIEGCLTVLQVLTSKIKKRQQLLQKIRYIFIQCRQKILKLKSIDKARTLLYLCYNFDQIFRQSAPKQTLIIYSPTTTQYYNLITQCLQQNQTLTKCALMFYETYCDLQPQTTVILDRIIDLIDSTKQVEILSCMTKILYEMISTIDIGRLKTILDRCLNRLFMDNEQYMKSLKNNAVYSNISMLKCLQSIKIIALYCKSIKNQDDAKDVMAAVWKVFNLFDFIQQTNYGEDLIKIFDAVISYLKVIDGPYFYQFLTNFAMYHEKQKEVGRIFYTYLALIIKGRQFLQCDSQGQSIMNHIVQNLMIVIKKQQKDRSTVAVVLLQYILSKFPKISYNHEEIYLRTSEMIRTCGQDHHHQEAIAAVYNLWIIGSSISECYDLGELDRLNLFNVYGYHARVFALAITTKVISLYNQIRDGIYTLDQNLQKIIYLLRISIQFLIKFTQQTKNKNTKIEYKIEQYSKINPIEKLRQTFIFLKSNLHEEHYNQIIRELEVDISRPQLNKLLNRHINQARVIFKFK